MRTLPKVAAQVLALLLLSTAALAEPVVIHENFGGYVDDYLRQLEKYRRTKQRVEIAGECVSGCTLYLGSPYTCVRPEAVLHFHAPHFEGTNDISKPALRVFMRTYPPKVREWIKRRGGLTTEFIVLKGPELKETVKMCWTRRHARGR